MTAHFVQLLEELQRRSLRMASLVEDMVQEACESTFDADAELARRVVSRDNEVDAEEVKIEAEIVRLMALYQPVGSDLRLLCAVLKIINDLERIADCAVNIAERAEHLGPRSIDEHGGEVRQMATLSRRMLRSAVQAYSLRDESAGRAVLGEDDTVDALYAQITRSIVEDASKQPELVATYLDILSIARNLERIADHATNIAEDVVFMVTGEIVRHCEP